MPELLLFNISETIMYQHFRNVYNIVSNHGELFSMVELDIIDTNKKLPKENF